jgi:hypothetical protein
MSEIDNETLETIRKTALEALGSKDHSRALIAIHDYCASLINKDAEPAANPITKEGWVNIYPTSINRFAARTGDMVYPDEAAARKGACVGRSVATVKITWEE